MCRSERLGIGDGQSTNIDACILAGATEVSTLEAMKIALFDMLLLGTVFVVKRIA